MSTSGLVRDFTDEEKSEIISIIKALNEEDSGFLNSTKDWFGDTAENIGGFFGGEYDISDYLDDIEKYHRKVMDKKNSSEEQINKIFDAVNQKDGDYKKLFNSIKYRLDVLKDSMTSIADILDPSPAEGKEFKLSKPDFTARGINDKLVDYYYNKYKKDNDYDWQLIRETAHKKPEEISEAEYAALCKIIDDFSEGDEVDVERYNKFLNAFYINPKADPKDTMNYHLYHRQEVDCELSPVFNHMASRYIVYRNSELNKYFSKTGGNVYKNSEGDNAQRIIFNMSVLGNVCHYGKVGSKNGILDNSYYDGFQAFVEAINLKKSDKSEADKYDYDLNIREIGKYEIKTYNNGNELYDKIQGEEIQYLDNQCGDGIYDMGLGLTTVAMGFGKKGLAATLPYFSAVICTLQALAAPGVAEQKKQECVNMGDARTIGRMLESCKVNASITINGQKVYVNYATIDEKSLELLLWMYNEETNNKLTKEQCKDFLFKGNNSLKDDAMKYCNWYYDEGDKTIDALKNFYAGISKDFGGKKFNELSMDQKKEVYRKYKEALGD